MGPTLGPLLQPLAGLLLRLPRWPPLVLSHRLQVPCPFLVPFCLPLVFVRVEVAVAELWSLRLHRGLPPADDFVPSHDGVLALIRDELQAIQSQLIPESPPLPVLSVAGGPQSGELPF